MNKKIRWGSNDRKNLQKAVNNFNAKLKRLVNQGIKNLPSKVSYKALRGWGSHNNEIMTRKELNQTIRDLKEFSKRGAEKEVVLPSGETITNWENRQISKMKRRAKLSIGREIKELEKKRQFGMGDKELQAKKKQLASFDKLRQKEGFAYRRGYKALQYSASADKEMKEAQRWYDNYMYALKEMSGGYDNSEVLIEKLESFDNPMKAYDYIKNNDILEDLMLFYKEKATSKTFEGYGDNQEAFDKALIDLGLNDKGLWL